MSHDRWAAMVGAYVLDALEAEERAAFEARLAEDAELRRLVDEAQSSTLVLAEALPDVEPPAALRERILERARRTDRAATDDVGTRGRTEPDIGRPGAGNGPRLGAVPWMLLAASVGGLFWMAVQNRSLETRGAALEAQLDSVRASLGSARLALARFDSLALALSGPNVQLATLTGDADPSLRLVWNRDRDLLLVAAQNLPPLPQGRTYQLWGIRGSEPPVGLGTFDIDATGSALVTLPASSAGDFEVSAITEEPVGGSPQPTTTPFLVGSWSSAQ